MQPVISVAEMRAIDEAAPEPTGVLVERSGAAVAWAARRLLGGTYGRRVTVVAGKGNNGADGRAAARRLARWGARVTVMDAAAPAGLEGFDLVIDGAYGTGFRGEYAAPDPMGVPVLAVDIPSGVHGDTGEASAAAVVADHTVTFAALKPGLLLGQGPARAGTVEVADIGLDTGRARMHLVEDADVAAWLPEPERETHKWRTAVLVVAGSVGMLGAAQLTSRAAMRAGAGMVRLGTPGAQGRDFPAGEMVGLPLPAEGWDAEVLEGIDRYQALALGPGLGRSPATTAAVRRVVAHAPVPVVVDADGLNALEGSDLRSLRDRPAATVLTPHDGEYARLAGHPPGADRVTAARELAAATGAIVLLKGSTTVVADPDGDVLLAAAGGPRLATAGTGDVLTGMVAAFLAGGLLPDLAAAAAAHAHGRAAHLGPSRGLVAGDVVALVPAWLSSLERP